MLVRLDHIASFITNANYSGRRSASFGTKLLARQGKTSTAKMDLSFVHCNLVRIEMPTLTRLGDLGLRYFTRTREGLFDIVGEMQLLTPC